MPLAEHRPLSLSNAEFASLRANNQIYIDKTDLIVRLASTSTGKFFLARPRRFGKSLLLSTFASLFGDGLKHFDGLAAAEVWKDKTYPILRLDFSILKEAATPEQLRQKFNLMLLAGCAQSGLRLPDVDDPFAKLVNLITSAGISNLVLLIDEYDAPLAHHLHEPNVFQLHQKYQSDIFTIVKSLGGYFRFFFMTGVGKFRHSGIFSGFNFLTDLSLAPEYNTLLGITEAELEHYYAPHLATIEEQFSMSHEALIERLRLTYDGYCFSKDTTSRIYNPWSILSFLSMPDKDFPNYWYQSSGEPAVLTNYLATHELSDPKTFFTEKSILFSDLQSSHDFNSLNELSLLQQTGYPTIDRFDGKEVILKYPNLEVTESMAALYSKVLLKGKTLNQLGSSNVKAEFETGTPDSIISIFNNILLNLSYGSYKVPDGELACRDALALVLFGAGLHPDIEKHNAFGRSDLEVCTSSRHWVFELKFARNEAQEDELLQKAVEQTIQRRYGEGDLNNRKLIRIAAVYSAGRKQISRWKVVE